jgi:type VI secretion system protein ImpM
MHDAPGFYGKAPARGDFVSRRMPNDFVATWDIWLQTMLTESKSRLGDGWLAAWLEAPVWHFTFGRGVAAPEPAIGVLIPSVDRVGRHFPFSILGLCRDDGMPPELWAPRIEELALGALDDGFDPEILDHDLAALGPPRDVAGSPAALPPLGWSPRAGADCWRIADAGETIWWCRTTARVPAATLRAEGLPAPADSACLIATSVACPRKD